MEVRDIMSFGQHEYPDHLWDPAYMGVEMESPRIEIYDARKLKVGRKLHNWRMIGENGSDVIAGSNQGYSNRAALLDVLGETVLGAVWAENKTDDGGELGSFVRPASFNGPNVETQRIAVYIV